MFPRILHLYGPMWIYSYGTMIALGFMIFLWLTVNHPMRKKLINVDLYTNIIFGGLLAGLIGGRTLFIINYPEHFSGNWISILFPWVEGLMIIGAIIGVILYGFVILSLYKIPVLKIFDLVAAYAPLMQSISRIGCFASGCCYGAPAPGLLWAVTFTDPAGNGPLNIPLHPTQLYMCGISLIIFLITRAVYKKGTQRPGVTVLTYLMLETLGRIIIDFWRSDRAPYLPYSIFEFKVSYVQLWAACVMLGAIIGIIALIATSHNKKS